MPKFPKTIYVEKRRDNDTTYYLSAVSPTELHELVRDGDSVIAAEYALVRVHKLTSSVTITPVTKRRKTKT